MLTARDFPSFRCAGILLVFAGIGSLCGSRGSLCRADQPDGRSTPIVEFCALSHSEQVARVVRALEQRLAATNIRYDVLIEGELRHYDDGQVGKLIKELVGSKYRHVRLGDDYRLDTDRGTESVQNPTHFVSSAYDARQEVARTTMRFRDGERKFGRVDVFPLRGDASNRYAYWLDGKHNDQAEYFIRYLVDHADSLSIHAPTEKGQVRVIVPWHPYGFGNAVGSREFVLDPQKGLMPVSGKSRWDAPDGDWRVEEFAVKDSLLVGALWMPTKIREVIAASTLPVKCNVWNLDVSKIELGKVVPADVEVSFLPGMEVVDAIEGVSYTMDADGKRINERQLVGTRPARR